NRPPRLRYLIKTRHGAVPHHSAQVNSCRDDQREHSCEIENANQRAENNSVRPTGAMSKHHSIWQPEKTENAPACVLPRLYIQVGTEHEAAKEHRTHCQ